MAALTLSSDVVKDGNGTAVTGGVQTYVDPNRGSAKGAVVAVVMGDGTVLTPGQALAAASIPVVLTAAQLASLTAPVLAAGTNIIGATTQQAATSGGATPYSFIAAAGANQDSTVVKASAGQVYGGELFNTSAAARYVKIYDKATGPTSADTPIRRYYLPAGGGSLISPFPKAFANGISFRITTGVADNDANAATANDVLVNLDYK